MPNCQPGVNFGNSGIFLGSPSGMPACTHSWIVRILIVGQPAIIAKRAQLLDCVPWRHVSALGDARDQLAAFAHILISQQREWRCLSGPVAGGTHIQNDGSHVFGECTRVWGWTGGKAQDASLMGIRESE